MDQPATTAKPVRRRLAQYAQAMLKLYQKGSTVYEIALEYNCSPHSVRNQLRFASNRSIEFRHRSGAKGLSQYRQEMQRLHGSGQTYDLIAAQFGCTAQTVRYHVANTPDVQTRKQDKKRHGWGVLSAYREIWVDARKRGETIASIAARYNCSAPSVAYQLQAALREAEVKARSASRSPQAKR